MSEKIYTHVREFLPKVQVINAARKLHRKFTLEEKLAYINVYRNLTCRSLDLTNRMGFM